MISAAQPADQLLLNHRIQCAEAVATRYQRSHPRLNLDDCLSIAREVAWQCLKGAQRVTENLVEQELRALLYKVKRESDRYVSLENIAGYAEGDPLTDIYGLRSAESLNPRAANVGFRGGFMVGTAEPLKSGLLDALGSVTASAVKQNCPQHPEHEWYLSETANNQARVKSFQDREPALIAQKKEYHLRNAPESDELPKAA